jgi:hypothetical protein
MQPQNVFKEKIEIPKVVPSLNEGSISPTVINRIIIGIILLIILIQIGFFKTYIQHFPKFEEYTAGHGNTKYNFIMHFHGVMMMGWVWMLLLQPILILKGKIKLHHLIGSLSYVLAPLVLLSLYLANRDQYHNLSAHEGQTAAIASLALALPEAVFFAILYSLAIFYRHQPALHMRFMCSTAFLFINPALGRMFRTYFALKPGFAMSSPIVLSLVGIITVVDSLRTKRISPFTLVFGLLLLHKIIWELRDTPFWQSTGSVIAKMF